MTKIALTNGHFALVDDEDFPKLNAVNWSASRQGKTWYAYRHLPGSHKTKGMHRVLMGDPIGMQIDHINGNGLHNQRSNLRIVTSVQNSRHRPKNVNNASGFKGVFFHKASSKWISQIRVDRKLLHLGLFTDKREAAQAYNAAAIEHFGQFAHLNYLAKRE